MCVVLFSGSLVANKKDFCGKLSGGVGGHKIEERSFEGWEV